MANGDISCQAFVDAVKALSEADVTVITRDNTWSGGGLMGGLLG